MKDKIAFGVLIILCVTACGDYAALEAIEDNKKTADSLFKSETKLLDEMFKPICDSMHKVHYDRAVDSIKQLRIEGIQGLIDPEKTH